MAVLCRVHCGVQEALYANGASSGSPLQQLGGLQPGGRAPPNQPIFFSKFAYATDSSHSLQLWASCISGKRSSQNRPACATIATATVEAKALLLHSGQQCFLFQFQSINSNRPPKYLPRSLAPARYLGIARKLLFCFPCEEQNLSALFWHRQRVILAFVRLSSSLLKLRLLPSL